MKQVIITLIAVLTLTTAYGKNRVEIERDSMGNIQRIIELRDTVVNGKSVVDTQSVTTYHGAASEVYNHTDDNFEDAVHLGEIMESQLNGVMEGLKGFMIIALIATIGVFLLPAIIIFVVLYYQNRKRKERYQVIEKAVESGQPLPEEFVRETKAEDDTMRTKGIKNVFLGLGLAIFLYAMTDVFFLACIGLMIMLNGIGQLVIYFTRSK